MKHQSGLTILEVLIALAVLSIGLAGLAIMHFNSLKYVHSAYYRSVVSAVALDFEERLWLELADATVDCPDITSTGTAYTSLIADWVTRTSIAHNSTNYNSARIRSLSVSSAGSSPTPPYAEFPVTLSWTESRFDDPDDEAITDESAAKSFQYNVRVLCKSNTTGSMSS